MQLTQFTDYALRTLIYLGDRPDRLATISEIAQWHDISKPHLVKVVHHLAKLGYIKSTRGKGGGICLGMSSADINIGKLVRETEPNFHTVECFDKKNNRCRITDYCTLKHALHDATDAFLHVLDQQTLKSITQPEKMKERKNDNII